MVKNYCYCASGDRHSELPPGRVLVERRCRGFANAERRFSLRGTMPRRWWKRELRMRNDYRRRKGRHCSNITR